VPVEPHRPPPFGAVIGIDLAWGSRARSGIAVLDDAGRLLLVDSVITDSDLDATLAPFLAGSCVVGLDAPLIVTNPTGRRPCEALLSKAFSAQHAGCYPSNTGLAAFADGGRAAAFARRHELSVDATVPVDAGRRRALEVYPHSTIVALFELPRVLAYKVRPHRSVDSRRAELLRLVQLLATLDQPRGALDGYPALLDPEGRLVTLHEGVAGATTSAALRRLEDPVDAIVCADASLLFLHGWTAIIGDAQTGAIVTPIRERHLEALGQVRKPASWGRGTRKHSPTTALQRDGGRMSLTDEDILTTPKVIVNEADADQTDADADQTDADADQTDADADQTDADADQSDPK
jgi:predicted RNase H-like nuclease